MERRTSLEVPRPSLESSYSLERPWLPRGSLGDKRAQQQAKAPILATKALVRRWCPFKLPSQVLREATKPSLRIPPCLASITTEASQRRLGGQRVSKNQMVPYSPCWSSYSLVITMLSFFLFLLQFSYLSDVGRRRQTSFRCFEMKMCCTTAPWRYILA